MIFFRSDYSAGAHPEILKAFETTNFEHTDGYGEDEFCYSAAKLIKEKVGRDDVDVHFLVGGTQTNLTAISAFLRPHEAAVSARSGHICVHETGAIEATGHKIIHLPSPDGKVLPHQIKETIIEHEDEHMVLPKLLYISNSTEIGTIYSKAELKALRESLDKHNMYLYMDGARLASALTSEANKDLRLTDLAEFCDAFYIGGTKNGFLFGEALVIVNDALKKDFRYLIKQRGGMFAKGRLLGIQFETMFKNDLYFDLARKTNDMASMLRKGIAEKGYEFFVDSPTNQIFPIFPTPLVESLEKKYFFYRWCPYGLENTAIRLVTSFTTTEQEINEFLKDI